MRHHLPLIAACVILAVNLAAFYVSTLSSTYTSSAVVLLSPAPGNPLTVETASSSGVQLTVAMETEEQLVPTVAVRSAVSEALGREVPEDNERLQVTVRPNTQMLEIEFTTDSPEKAQAGAQGFAQGYLDYRAEQARATQEGRVEALQQQVDETDADLRRATDQAAESDASSYASQEVQLYAARLAQLSTTLSSVQSVGTDPGSIINPAEVPTTANELPTWLLLVAAGGGGLFLGVLVAVLREWRQDLVRGGESTDAGVPVFADIDAQHSSGPAATGEGAAHEAFRQLRAAVIANGPRPHVLAVTPIDRDHTTVAAGLAKVLAEAKQSVLLIATDPHDLGASRALGLGERAGVAEVVSRGTDVSSLLEQSQGVSVLAPGLESVDMRDLAAMPAFRDLIQQMRQRYDYVVLEGAPAADELLLAADSVLLVLTQNQTTRTRVLATLERFEQLGVEVLGAVRVRDGRGDAAPPSPSSPPPHSRNGVVIDHAEFRASA